MQGLPALAAFAVLLAGCGKAPTGSVIVPGDSAGTPGGPVQAAAAAHWSQDGNALALVDDRGEGILRIACNSGRVAVNVPAFQPIGSEERMSFGSGGEVVALVANAHGDPERGGVTGEGVAPDRLDKILSGAVSVSYGSQVSGPHAAPPANLAAAEVAACTSGTAAATPATQPASACLTQDGGTIAANRLRAVGTEPFWGARIEGRCVIYLTPENQGGTRVWTRFSGSRDAGAWVGALNGKPFELRTSPSPSCSDGMSDKIYPVAVTLTVAGETRAGCAEPL